MTGKSAFVTGGTGFVGSHVVEHLLDRGYDHVRCLVRSEPKWLTNLDVEFVQGDLGSLSSLKRAVRGVEYVYHIGGLTRARSIDELRQVNVEGTTNLIKSVDEVAPYVRRVLVTSSLSTIGRSDEPVANEETPLRPISMYGRSKAEMEEELRQWTSRLPITVIRPSAVYGPRESDIYTYFKSAAHRLTAMVGDGLEPEINLVYVTDAARGIVDAAEAESAAGNTYFIGSEKQYSWSEINEAVIDALGHRVFTVKVPESMVERVGTLFERGAGLFGKYPPLNREKAREILTGCKMCSVERAKEDFAYSQRVPLEDGVRRTVVWYRDHGWL